MYASRTVSEEFSRPCRRLIFLVTDGFSMHSLTSVTEPLLLANRELEFDAYQWRIVSQSGREIRSSLGLSVKMDGSLTSVEKSDHIIVCASSNTTIDYSKPVLALLRRHHATGGVIGSLGNGAFALAQAGVLNNKAFTVHWECRQTMVESYPELDVQDRIFVADNRVLTSAGGAASAELALELISQDFGLQMANQVAELCVRPPKATPEDRQRSPVSSVMGTGNRVLVETVSLMQGNLETPIKLTGLALRAGVSRRQLERVFRQYTGQSPGQFYREIRIAYARKLIAETDLPITEIMFASGFESASCFNQNFKKNMGVPRQRFGKYAERPAYRRLDNKNPDYRMQLFDELQLYGKWIYRLS